MNKAKEVLNALWAIVKYVAKLFGKLAWLGMMTYGVLEAFKKFDEWLDDPN